MEQLDLTNDELLTTTRAVRKRLDFDREVPRELLVECVRAAMQSPSGSNNPTMQFLIVTDRAKIAAIGELYAQAWGIYSSLDGVFIGSIRKEGEAEQAQQDRSTDSAAYLAGRMGEVPVMVIACHNAGRLDGAPGSMSAAVAGNVLPAMWSFMLKARTLGLGTAWTTLHLFMEQQVAEICGIPYDSVQQMVLTPVAFTKGTEFKPALRPDPETIIHWDTW